MKSFSLLILLSIAVSFAGCENEVASSQVPSVVQNTFKQHFPHAKDIEWELVDKSYEVSFEIENIDHKASLDSTGNLLKYKYDIIKSSVPKNIKSFLDQEYSQEKWEDLEHVIDGNSQYFQLEINGFFKDKKMVVDSIGKTLSNTKYWN